MKIIRIILATPFFAVSVPFVFVGLLFGIVCDFIMDDDSYERIIDNILGTDDTEGGRYARYSKGTSPYHHV
jgi:hypothetical protein